MPSAMSPLAPPRPPIRPMRNGEQIAADRQKITDGGVLDILLDHVRGGRELTQSQLSTTFGLLKKILPDFSSSAARATARRAGRTGLPHFPNSRSTLSTRKRLDVARAFMPLVCPNRYKDAYGGRGSAKSHFFAEQLVWPKLWGGEFLEGPPIERKGRRTRT